MYSLILKDILMLKKMLLLIAGFIALFYFLENPPVMAISLAGIIFISSTGSFEDRSNSHIMLNSLPINRKSIISSKYVGAILFGIFATVLATLFQMIFYFILDAYDKPLPNANQLVLGMLIILLFSALYFPILYKFGEKYTRIILMIVIFGFIIFGQMAMYALKGNIEVFQLFLTQFTFTQLTIVGFAITIIVFIFSWLATIKIYEAKDF
ncbi:ABC-2 transporter permease [Heyndrickxia oleronia]|uniref:ABC-2 transporter permease n=1 Tax=Heyndrickxia oleronia TaxID=38875 RepID=UPI002042004D|nr:ABC-2 transporter permease [Heyndrickxia oleronia]MCM3239692.1 ABC-2 transporter permease [Heyndrickxia oleronia]